MVIIPPVASPPLNVPSVCLDRLSGELHLHLQLGYISEQRDVPTPSDATALYRDVKNIPPNRLAGSAKSRTNSFMPAT